MNKFICRGIFLGIFSLQFSLSAVPRIAVDKADIDAGTVYDGGSGKVVSHTFILKNTGDQPLIIERVKTSCGCTAVNYDSIIRPGAEGKVTQEIIIDRINYGEFRKYINVISNAKNDSTLRLSLGGVLKSHVAISRNFIQMTMDTAEKRLKSDIQITSTAEDLQISEVSFKSYNDAASGPSWQSALLLFMDYKLTASKDSTSGHSYQLKISTDPANKQLKQGRFTIKTNHPLKPELSVEGSMQ